MKVVMQMVLFDPAFNLSVQLGNSSDAKGNWILSSNGRAFMECT
jgi:hypothetical protein